MTRKHFKAIAEALSQTSRRDANWKRTCENVAAACRQFNGAFDRGRFLRACGYYDAMNEVDE